MLDDRPELRLLEESRPRIVFPKHREDRSMGDLARDLSQSEHPLES